MIYKKMIILSLLLSASISACCTPCPTVDPKQQLVVKFDDFIIPLGKAVDIIVDKLPPDATDKQIFDEVLKRSGNPMLLKPFEGYVLKARIQDGVGIILLCSPDGKEGIIEDVSCTTRPDSYRPSGSPCTYLLDPKLVCSSL